jgi:hypothetical protein
MSKKLFLSLLVVALAAFIYQSHNSTTSDDPYLLTDIKIISHDSTVEKHLTRYQELLGDDYAGYRGHIYRVLTYSLHFLHGSEEKRSVIAAALVFHDLGLWTDHTLAYLEPSVKRAEEYFDSRSWSLEDRQLLKDIIYWHHKLTPYQGPAEAAEVINAVIKADLIDASFGLITKGMPRAHIEKVSQAIPENNFHKTLLEFGPRLHGWNVIRIVTDLSSILKW